MGRRLISQRRGRGTTTYRTPPRKFRPAIKYNKQKGIVKDIVNHPAMNSPLAKVRYADNSEGFVVAPEGLRVGDSTEKFVMPLSEVSEGSQVFAVETYPNSGPKLCRTSGSFAIVASKTKDSCIIKLPSKKTKKLNSKCVVSLGIPAGEGRGEKPFVKAGKKWIVMHARGKLYPRTSGKGMNIVDHPYGGSGHGKARPPVSRHAPPGRKVGSISPKRTGKKKK